MLLCVLPTFMCVVVCVCVCVRVSVGLPAFVCFPHVCVFLCVYVCVCVCGYLCVESEKKQIT